MTFQDHAINRHLVARHHTQTVSDIYLLERNLMITVRCHQPRGGRRELKQGFDGAAGAAARAQFQHLAQQHQHDDDRGGFEINIDPALVLHGMGNKPGISIATVLNRNARQRPFRSR